MTAADEINWSEWHKAEPAQRIASGGKKNCAAASVTARPTGEVVINFNSLAMVEYGFAKGDTCDIFEGLAERTGWLLICKNPKGKFQFSGCGVRGLSGVLIRRFKPEWAPEFKQKKRWVTSAKVCAAVAVELPDWFDRELRASELRAA